MALRVVTCEELPVTGMIFFILQMVELTTI